MDYIILGWVSRLSRVGISLKRLNTPLCKRITGHSSSKKDRKVFPFTFGSHLTHIVSAIKALSSQEFLGVVLLPSVSIHK